MDRYSSIAFCCPYLSPSCFLFSTTVIQHCIVPWFFFLRYQIRDGEREEDSIFFSKATVANSYTTCIYITLTFLPGK